MKSKKQAAPDSENDSKKEKEHGLKALVVKAKKQNEVLRKLIEKINDPGQKHKK